MSVTVSSRAPASVESSSSGFAADFVRGTGSARSFLPRHLSREADWEKRIEEAASMPPAAAVWARAAADGERLGAGRLSLENCRALGAGECLCVTTGQQPGLFLGPLYTVYKAMTAVALAQRVAEKSGLRVAPVFWNAADDSDFGEVQAAFLPDEHFALSRHALDGGSLPAGGMVGDLATEETRSALAHAKDGWDHHRAGAIVVAKIEAALARARDHGELSAALLHELFAGTGLVIVDGRWEELRRQAAPLFLRWAEQANEAARAIDGAGAALKSAGYGVPLTDGVGDGALFDISNGRRNPFAGSAADLRARIEQAPGTLSPNVTLRPLVQDTLFPNVATVGGPSEIHYHAQLAGEYELLGAPMPILFPRFEATLVPAGVWALAARRQVPVEELVRDFDGTLKATAERALPGPLRAALDDLHSQWEAGAERFRAAAGGFDPKLPGAVDDAGKRVQSALEKLREKAARAARQNEARLEPALPNFREFLRPRGVPQERVLSSLTLFLASQEHPLQCLSEALEGHLVATRDGRPLHWLLEFGGCPGEES